MAKQKGIIKLKGTMGDITFYKTKDGGYIARERGGVDGKRIASDPAFRRTRENGQEFGHAGRSGKLIRAAFRSSLVAASDGRVVSRLTQALVRVLQGDTQSARGERQVALGDFDELRHFEFNKNSQLTATVFVPFTSAIDRVAGTMSVAFPTFNPFEMIVPPGGTTHFKLFVEGSGIDFGAFSFEGAQDASAILPMVSGDLAPITLALSLPAGMTVPLFLGLGISFYQEVNGEMYPLRNGAFNPFSFVAIES